MRHKEVLLLLFALILSSSCVMAKSKAFQSSSPLPESLEGLILKSFPADWENSLYAKGQRRWRSGNELKWIGMPIGGLYAGQLYLGGDGKLWLWDVFNEHIYTWGGHYKKPLDPYGPRRRWLSNPPPDSVNQGFALKWKGPSGQGVSALDKKGFEDIEFCGEYPMGFVKYHDASVPLSVDLVAFSPFVPLSADDSSFPATVMQYIVSNTSDEILDIKIGGWLGNHVLLDTGAPVGLLRRKNTIASRPGLTTLMCRVEPDVEDSSMRPDMLIDRFDAKGYQGWTVSGDAFGTGPADKWRVMEKVYADVDCPYNKLIHTFFTSPGKTYDEKKKSEGRLLGDAFAVERDYVGFWIGGGDTPEKTCVNLLINGSVVHSATGRHDSRMRLSFFDVKRFAGQEAKLEVVVDNYGQDFNWISATGFIQTDNRISQIKERSRDYGTMALSLIGNGRVTSYASLPDTDLLAAWKGGVTEGVSRLVGTSTLDDSLTGALTTHATLKPGETRTFSWLITWHFPNQLEGNAIAGRYYATRFANAGAVAEAIARDFSRLEEATRLWHDTWYDSSLPQWFLDRTFQNTSILATSTCRRYKNGQFWAWEGAGSCAGTCTHVWQYAQAMGRLFPELERDLRTRTDYGFAFMPDGGIRMRGSFLGPAIDGQAGCILRTLREHQMSRDNQFLRPLWPRVKRAMQYLITRDSGKGLLEGAQHNTLDSDWQGQIAWLSGLYIAALRATEEMATEMGDRTFAHECRMRWQRGSKAMVDTLFNGTYFINVLDPDHLDSINSGTGCLIDQVMGQSWAFQVGLGRILPQAETRSALRSLWDYNFTTDVGPFRAKYTNARDFAVAGEPGLIMCTFPDPNWDINKAAGPNGRPIFVGYLNECQSGYEYEVASHMIAEGMVTQGLSVVKAIDTRYSPESRNPFNEIEAGSHYARSMAVYGSFITACGYEYHGPKGYLAFNPKIGPDAFKAAFTAAEGWGSLEQKRRGKTQLNSISVKYGSLRLKTISLEIAAGMKVHECVLKLAGKPIEATFKSDGSRATLELEKHIVVPAGKTITIELK